MTSKGKNAAMDKWDQETRAALAAKKKQGSTTLTKAERALVDAQLANEAKTRARVVDALSRVHQSLRIIRSLLSLSTEERDQFLPPMVFSLLAAVSLQKSTMFAEEGLQTVLVRFRIQAVQLPSDCSCYSGNVRNLLLSHRRCPSLASFVCATQPILTSCASRLCCRGPGRTSRSRSLPHPLPE